MSDTLLLAVWFLIAALLIGIYPILLALLGYLFFIAFGATVFISSIMVTVLVLYAAFTWFRRSFWKGLVDVFAFGLIVIGWVISKFAIAIHRLGSIISFMSGVKRILGLYPGKDFIENRREELVQLGIKYYRQGDLDINEPPEALARDIRKSYDDAGRRLSNGEVVLGLTLAGVTLLPSNTSSVPYSQWLSSPLVGAGLSVALVLVVTLRLSALDMVLVRDPSITESKPRLDVYRGWNQAMSSGVGVVKVLLMFRVIHDISDSAYDFYLNWVFERDINGDGVGTIELLYEMRQPLFAFQIAERECMSPIQASQKKYGRNVFASFSFGPGKDESSSGERGTNLLDSVLLFLLEFKYAVGKTHRITKVRKLAEENDMTLQEASLKLYGENVLPEILEGTEESIEREGTND